MWTADVVFALCVCTISIIFLVLAARSKRKYLHEINDDLFCK